MDTPERHNAHLLRDLEDAAQSYPGAIWPGQVAEALRALIHAANTAREQGLDAVPGADTAAALARTRSSRRPGCGRNACTTASRTSSGSFLTCGYPPHPTAPNATCGPLRPSRRSPAGSAPKKPPATGTPSAATYPPPPSTAPTSSPPSTAPSPATPGCHPSPNPRNPASRVPHPSHATQHTNPQLGGEVNVYDGTDLAIVFVFTRVEFTFPWLLGRRDVARPLESLVGDNRSGKVENLLHSAFQLLHVMVTSRRRV